MLSPRWRRQTMPLLRRWSRNVAQDFTCRAVHTEIVSPICGGTAIASRSLEEHDAENIAVKPDAFI